MALSRGNPTLAEIFQYRLPIEQGATGQCLGNLIVSALLARSGSLWQAVRLAAGLLQSAGQVLPSSEAASTLCAEFQDGAIARGEAEIVARRMRIRRVWLEPQQPPPAPGVLEAIHAADAVVLGPGSLYTSILPNLLPVGVCRALRCTRALKIVVCNLMTQPGETDGLSAASHLRALESYLGTGAVDICLLNSRTIRGPAAGRYKASGYAPVLIDDEEIARTGALPVSADLLQEEGAEIRHDPRKLARLVVALARGGMRRSTREYGDSTRETHPALFLGEMRS